MITRNRKSSRKATTPSVNHNVNLNSNVSSQIKVCKVVLNDIGSRKMTGEDEMKNKSLISSIKPCVVALQNISKGNTQLTPSTELGDGKKVIFFKCKSKLCGLKEFIARDKAISSCTKRVYECITPPGTSYVDCHSSNLIYLLTCLKCGLQYVGETVQQLNARFTMHRSGIKMPEKHGTCKILSSHFNTGLCKGADYCVQILEKLEGTGRTERKAIDVSMTSHRRKREEYWMKTLRTVYQYGLNDRVSDDYTRRYFLPRFSPVCHIGCEIIITIIPVPKVTNYALFSHADVAPGPVTN